MAIDDHPDVPCSDGRHHPNHRPPAAGFIPSYSNTGCWWAKCQDCLNLLADDPDIVPVLVAYLDPARQRRPVDNAGGIYDPAAANARHWNDDRTAT